MWNIRNSECSAGRPAVIYDAPELFGGYESGRPVAINDLSLAKKFSLQPSLFGCTTNFLNFVSSIMHENNLQMPESISDAQQLYKIKYGRKLGFKKGLNEVLSTFRKGRTC